MAAAGADVALLGRNGRDLAEVAAEVTAYGVRAVPLAVDLVDSAAVEGVVNRAAADLGRLGVLVNAAGTDVPGSAEELSLADWERVVAVNHRSLCPHQGRHAAPTQRGQRAGRQHLLGCRAPGVGRRLRVTVRPSLR